LRTNSRRRSKAPSKASAAEITLPASAKAWPLKNRREKIGDAALLTEAAEHAIGHAYGHILDAEKNRRYRPAESPDSEILTSGTTSCDDLNSSRCLRDLRYLDFRLADSVDFFGVEDVSVGVADGVLGRSVKRAASPIFSRTVFFRGHAFAEAGEGDLARMLSRALLTARLEFVRKDGASDLDFARFRELSLSLLCMCGVVPYVFRRVFPNT